MRVRNAGWSSTTRIVSDIWTCRRQAYRPLRTWTRENGWEAGIRTPITASRAPCPTVERPPSGRPRRSTRRELPMISAEPRRSQATCEKNSDFGHREDWLAPLVAGHAAFAASLPGLLAGPLVRGSLEVGGLPTLPGDL